MRAVSSSTRNLAESWYDKVRVYCVSSFPSLNLLNVYAVFYFAHHTFLALFLAILWHAPSAWYYILPGLALWCVDHAVRFCNACRRVKVLQFQVQRDIISLGCESFH